MNDEIKEILDNFKIYEDRYKKCNETQFIIFYRDIHLLLDYITNLQQENERLKEENKHIFANVNDDVLLRSNAMNYAEAQDYKSRVENAVEYMKDFIFEPLSAQEDRKLIMFNENLRKFENILNGKE